LLLKYQLVYDVVAYIHMTLAQRTADLVAELLLKAMHQKYGVQMGTKATGLDLAHAILLARECY